MLGIHRGEDSGSQRMPRTRPPHHVLVRDAPREEVDALGLVFVFVLEVHFHSLPQGAEDIPASLTPQAQCPPGRQGGPAEGGQLRRPAERGQPEAPGGRVGILPERGTEPIAPQRLSSDTAGAVSVSHLPPGTL